MEQLTVIFKNTIKYTYNRRKSFIKYFQSWIEMQLILRFWNSVLILFKYTIIIVFVCNSEWWILYKIFHFVYLVFDIFIGCCNLFCIFDFIAYIVFCFTVDIWKHLLTTKQPYCINYNWIFKYRYLIFYIFIYFLLSIIVYQWHISLKKSFILKKLLECYIFKILNQTMINHTF